MKKINIKDKEIKLSKDFLTNGEVNSIVKEVIKLYREKGDIDGFYYNPLSLRTNFYALLFSFCINDFDLDDIDKYNDLYNAGVQNYLLENITNAKEAYNIICEIVNNLNSVSYVLNDLVNNFVSNMPSDSSMKNAMKSLTNNWNRVASEYETITGVSIKEDTNELKD